MKKVSKLIIACTLVISLCFSGTANVFAADAAPIQATEQNADSILLAHGFNEDDVDLIEMDKKIEIASALLINPDLVQKSASVSEIDELTDIERFVNTSEETLLESGMKQEDIDSANNLIQNWKASSDEELMERYDRDQVEIKMLRMACEPTEDYTDKEVTSTPVTSSGSISSSKLYFSTTATKQKFCGRVRYRVVNTFKWKSLPFVDFLTDEIVNAWGGSMWTSNYSSKLVYAYGDINVPGVKTKTYTAHYEEGPINAGFRFWTHQAQGDLITGLNYHQLWKGSASLLLTTNGNCKNKDTKILAQYGHHTIGWSGVSISKSPSISFGTGWDYSDQVILPAKY